MIDPKLEDLRQQLRTLGYLDAGVDRFLLAPARGTRGPVALAARSSIRVGLLGGALLGPAAALGLGGRLPGLISGVRDAIVIALYLGVLSFVCFAAVAFITSLVAAAVVGPPDSRFSTRARGIGAIAGWAVGLGCLLYLTFWWRNANAGFGWSAPVWTSFALLVAVGISLLLAHAVRITSLAVLASRARGAMPLPPVTARSWRVIVGGGVLAFCGAAVLLVLTAPAVETRERPPLTVVSTGQRVRLIAVDGFDLSTSWDGTPGGSALTSATLGPSAAIAAHDTSDPARAWTTIATGEPAGIHGVHGIETRRVAGLRGIVSIGGGEVARVVRTGTDLVRLTRPSVASRDERRVKTIWEVASDAGLRTAVVNWWATWPAPAGSGIVVTDRAVVRLERGGSLDAEIAPSELYPALARAWPGIRQRARESARQHFTTISDAALVAVLRRSAELDSIVIGLLDALPGPPRDLDLVYLPGLDIAQHTLLAPSGANASSASSVTARVQAVGAYYQFLDAMLVPLVRPRQPGLVVMLLTQPGRVGTPAAGLLSIAGEMPRGDSPARATPLDVAPTIAYALGLPLSRELPGHPLEALFNDEFRTRYPARFVPTYGPPSRAAAAARQGKPLDQEMIDRLRSLGYVK